MTAKLKPIEGLVADDFAVSVAERPQQICAFDNARKPVSIAIVWDTSGSMRQNYNAAKIVRMGVERLLDLAGPEDEFYLARAADTASTYTDFTTDLQQIRNGLTAPPKGGTALFDAIYRASYASRSARHRSRAVVIFSDGGDNASVYQPADIDRALADSHIPMFLVAPLRPGGPRTTLSLPASEGAEIESLQALTVKSGGYSVWAQSGAEMATRVSDLAGSLQRPYVFHFAGPKESGRLLVETPRQRPKPLLSFWGGKLVER
jgi:hypothetical protein